LVHRNAAQLFELADASIGKGPERVGSTDEYAKSEPDGLEQLFGLLAVLIAAEEWGEPDFHHQQHHPVSARRND
jgi:hypothetical protein